MTTIETGKIYNLKSNGEAGKKANIKFSLGVRKTFVTDQDKKDNKLLNFLPCTAWGERAEFIEKYFADGDFISVQAEYEPWDGKDGAVPQFRVSRADFVPGTENKGSGSSKGKSSRGDEEDRPRSRRSRDDEDREEGRSSSRSSRRGRDTEDEDDPPRRGRRGRELDEDGDVPF